MSVDLRIERFGLELVNRLLAKYLGKGFIPYSLADYADVEQEINDDVVRAVEVHMAFFRSSYSRIYQVSHQDIRSNHMDLLNFVMTSFPHQDLRNDEIMSKFISSCAFVMDLCMNGELAKDKIHLVWAMFVDLKMKDEFYLSGELRRTAWCACKPAHRFMELFGEKGVMSHDVDSTVRSLFSMVGFSYDGESDVPMVLQWVDFVVGDQTPRGEAGELETALGALKEVLDPFGKRGMVYEELVPAAEKAGMQERTCMRMLAVCKDSDIWPEFVDVLDAVDDDRIGGLVKHLFHVWMGSSSTKDTDLVDDRKISSKSLLSGNGYLLRNCIGCAGGFPFLPTFTLPDGNNLKESLESLHKSKSAIKEYLEGKERESNAKKQSTKMEESTKVDKSLLVETELGQQGEFPCHAVSIPEPSESGPRSTETISLSTVFSVLSSMYGKRITVPDSVNSKPEVCRSSDLQSSSKKKKRKSRRNA